LVVVEDWLGMATARTRHVWERRRYCSCWRAAGEVLMTVDCDQERVTVVSKGTAMSLPDCSQLNIPVNKMTSPKQILI
jgi:hypothetical protein